MLLNDGELLDVGMKPHEANLNPNTKILAVGALSSKISMA